VQPHYITAPAFDGMPDPLPRRCGLRQGLDEACSLVIPPAAAKHPDEPSPGGYEPGLGVEAYLAKLGGPQGFRAPIVSAIASYISVHGSAAAREPIKQLVRAAIARADHRGRSASEIERYESDKHLDEIFDWVLAHHGDQPPKGFAAEPPPHIVDPEIPIAEPENGGAELDARPPEYSDEALALRFACKHARVARFVKLWGEWLLWNGVRWRFDDTLQSFNMARAICRLASAEINDPRRVKLAAAIASAKTVAAVITLARADRRHAVTADIWDADLWNINCKGLTDS
jgi:D5 N terminal like